jgi:putative peptide zinc metalloprotease protein
VASKFFVVGALIAVWGLFTMFVMPLGKALHFLFTSPKLRRRQIRAFTTTALLAGGVAALIFFYPVPLRTQAEGVVWIPEDAFVRAGADGFVERVALPSGTRTTTGERLIVCEDPLLPARIRVLESRLRELRATYDAQWIDDRVAAAVTAEEMAQVTAELDDARRRTEELTVFSPRDGWFVMPDADDLPGRFVRRGELLGYVLDRDTLKARVVVSQGDVDFVRHRTGGVRIRFPERMNATFPAELLREVPAGTDQLPSRTLSVEGGGEIAIDPRDASGVKTFTKVFLFDIGLPPPEGLYKVGGRIFVRFDHGEEPLAWRWYRGIRRLFLRRFNA